MRLGDEWEPEVNRHILDLVHCSKKPLPFTHFALAHDYFADISMCHDRGLFLQGDGPFGQ